MHSLKFRLKLYRSQFDVSATRTNFIFFEERMYQFIANMAIYIVRV